MRYLILIVALIIAVLAVTTSAVQQQPQDEIVVKDVAGKCWRIEPRTYAYKTGLLSLQRTVVFKPVNCP